MTTKQSTGVAAVDVAVDGHPHLGALSYLVPDGMTVGVGDAVEVGFGTSTRNGCVIGPAADPGKAVKPVRHVWGPRASTSDVAFATTVATYHGADVAAAVARLAPSSGRGADPHQAGPLHCTAAPAPPGDGQLRRLLLAGPCHDHAAIAAAEAARLSADAGGGQVLVLCPTVADVDAVMTHLPSGAATLHAGAARGAWKGFTAGTVTVGVGTRGAALYSARRLAGIVVLHPEHPAHRESRTPRTHARDLASARARMHRLPLTVVTAKPGPSDVYAAAGHIVRLPGGWPALRVADRTAAGLDGDARLLPPAMRIAAAAARRRGHVPVVVAGRTRTVRRCRRCAAEAADCGYGCDPGRACRHRHRCPTCGHAATTTVTGWTPQRLQDAFGGDVHVVDAAWLTAAGPGTADTVILFDFDAWLHRHSWTPDVDAVAALADAAAAAGPAGTVVAGTWNPDHEGLRDVVNRGDTAAVAMRAAAEARSLGLPPYGRRITVTGTGEPPNPSSWPGQPIGPVRAGRRWTVTVICPTDRLPAAVSAIRAHTRRRSTTLLVE